VFFLGAKGSSSADSFGFGIFAVVVSIRLFFCFFPV
jgi:hypothetical protein